LIQSKLGVSAQTRVPARTSKVEKEKERHGALRTSKKINKAKTQYGCGAHAGLGKRDFKR
jgi:hypothetical protein